MILRSPPAWNRATQELGRSQHGSGRLQRFGLRIAVATSTWACVLGPPVLSAGIPEPDVIWYGTVQTRLNGQTVRLTTGTLAWRIEPVGGGEPWTITTTLTNVHDQFSFVLRLPCTSPEPGLPNPASPEVLSLGAPPVAYRRATVTLNGQPLSFVSAPTQFALGLTDRGQIERVDLLLATVVEDTDGDGLGDAWERQFFGGLNARPEDDPDHDGVNNGREFRAGTHPLDPQSRFEIMEIERVGFGLRLRWSSQPDHTYRVRRAKSPLAVGTDYVVLQGGIRATPPVNEYIDAAGAVLAPAFYLIEIEP